MSAVERGPGGDAASCGIDSLERRGIPVPRPFTPVPHTSRRGWLARFDGYAANPFGCDIDAPAWHTAAGPISLRALARRIVRRFDLDIARIADPASHRLAWDVLSGRSASWLEIGERPAGTMMLAAPRPRAGRSRISACRGMSAWS